MNLLIPQDVSYLDSILLENNLLKVVPSEVYSKIPKEHLALFGHKYGIYCFPTTELIEWLKQRVDLSSAIEIGSGNGSLARELKIPATDSRYMETDEIKVIYAMMRQPVTVYPNDIQKFDAISAVEKFKPKTVIGCWITHKYREEEHEREGNMYGVDEELMLQKINTYIMIGNEKVHSKKKILQLEHSEYKFPWLFSRSLEQTKNTIYVWERNTLLEYKE